MLQEGITLGEGDFVATKAKLLSLINRESTTPELIKQISSMLNRIGANDEAICCSGFGVNTFPGDKEIIHNYSFYLFGEGFLDEAAYWSSKALEIDKNFLMAINVRAVIARILGDNFLALRLLRPICSHLQAATNNLFRLHCALDQFEKARELWNWLGQKEQLVPQADYGLLLDEAVLRRQSARAEACHNTSGVDRVLLVLGQSNAANFAERLAPETPAAALFAGARLQPLSDPLPGADGCGGSLWPRLGQHLLNRNLARKPVFVVRALADTPIAQWAHPTSFGLAETLDRLRALGLEPTDVLWMQGEADNGRKTGMQRYYSLLLAVATKLRQMKCGAPIHIARISVLDGAACEKIRQAQLAVTALPGFYPGPDLDKIGSDQRLDDTHFSADGQETAARLWADTLSVAWNA